MSVCPECGSSVTPEMRYCSECGTPLVHGQSTVSYSPSFIEDEDDSSPEIDGAALIELDQVEGTPGRRMHDLRVEEPVVIGRGPSSGVFLDDVTVSRHHAEIRPGDGGFRIQDSGSLNGTYVNRVRVDAVDLRNGDEIQIGKYRFKFVCA